MTFNVKMEGTAELTNALVEAFSPVTEVLGTIGDRVRVYRHISLLRSIKRAREIALEENLKIKEPSLKFLIPYLEDCSLEDPDNKELMEMWARLLASASSNKKAQRNIFIRVLKEISLPEAKLLEYIISESTHLEYKNNCWLDDAKYDWSDSYLYIKIRDSIKDIGLPLNEKFPFERLYKEFIKSHEPPGCIIVFFDIAFGEKNNYPLDTAFTSPRTRYDDEYDPVSIETLKSLGLIGEYKSPDIWFGSYCFKVDCYFLTSLGADFVGVCIGSKLPNNS